MGTLHYRSARAWASGDVAVCIGGARCPNGKWLNTLTGEAGDGPTVRQFVRVTAVEPLCLFDPPDVGLEFAEFPGVLYPASAFRRIEPDIEPAIGSTLAERIRRCGARVPA